MNNSEIEFYNLQRALVECPYEQIKNLESQNTKLLQALSTLIDEHEECTDFEGWEAYICSPEAIHEASEILDSILN